MEENLTSPFLEGRMLDYIFEEMSEEEEADFDSYLDKNPHYAEIVQAYINLSLENHFTRNELKAYLESRKKETESQLNSLIRRKRIIVYSQTTGKFLKAAILILPLFISFYLILKVSKQLSLQNNKLSVLMDSIKLAKSTGHENNFDTLKKKYDSLLVINKNQNDVLPDAFYVNPKLEANLLAMTTLRSSNIDIQSPTPNKKYSKDETIYFAWQSNKNPVFLKLLDNKGNEVYKKLIPGNKLQLPLRLKPGLYYWQVETETDIIYAQRFIIDYK